MDLSDAIDMTTPITDEQFANVAGRFIEKISVNHETGCWEWTGATVSGYGQLSNIGVGANPLRAHRLSMYLRFGPLRGDQHIDHLCRVRNCVNPAHLEVVSPAENSRRAARVRVKATHCPRGHEHTITQTARGRRTVCRPCHNEASRRSRLRRMAAA